MTLEEFRLEESRDLHLGEPERRIYEQAGRLDLFDDRVPAVWIKRWRR